MGKLIVLEGIDGSGKRTQTDLLAQALRQFGEVKVFDFPQYDKTVFGAIIRSALQGELGDFRNLSPYLASMPYMLDRAVMAMELEQALVRGHVICNRYVPSNIAHQAAKIEDRIERESFIELIERAEYDELRLPRPDLVIYLDMSVSEAMRLAGQAREGPDQHEEDRDYQERVAEVYEHLAATRSDWQTITCVKPGVIIGPIVQPASVVLKPEQIHARVMKVVSSVLGQVVH